MNEKEFRLNEEELEKVTGGADWNLDPNNGELPYTPGSFVPVYPGDTPQNPWPKSVTCEYYDNTEITLFCRLRNPERTKPECANCKANIYTPY